MYYQSNRYTSAKKQTFEGKQYDSGFEAGYAQELAFRKKAGDIRGFDTHVKIELSVNGYLIENYYVDFKIMHNDGTIEYVETKGWASPMWRRKWKLFEALYGDLPGVKLSVVKQQDNFKLRELKKIKQNNYGNIR